jgi:transcriptional regulator with XRE-family HTH domain
MNPISLRINELIDKLFEGNNSKFANKIGVNEANVRNYRKGTLPKIDFIIKIYENIEFNFDWFLTGKGEILDEKPLMNENQEEKSNELLDTKNELIQLLKQENQRLKNEVAELKGLDKSLTA